MQCIPVCLSLHFKNESLPRGLDPVISSRWNGAGPSVLPSFHAWPRHTGLGSPVEWSMGGSLQAGAHSSKVLEQVYGRHSENTEESMKAHIREIGSSKACSRAFQGQTEKSIFFSHASRRSTMVGRHRMNSEHVRPARKLPSLVVWTIIEHQLWPRALC